ncbi:hypothetical protein V501_01035 [Pseudogymnoascus sp. VKM F-4519 (FW-2642)]|nr:hypothetical protein V501_01035 [Pseudogymnoascus sp. VKM F-4519 (FW-2642)]
MPFLLEEKAPVFWLDAPSKHGVERNPSIGSSPAFGNLLGQCKREAWVTGLVREFAGVERHKLCNVVQRAELSFENFLDDYKLPRTGVGSVKEVAGRRQGTDGLYVW